MIIQTQKQMNNLFIIIQQTTMLNVTLCMISCCCVLVAWFVYSIVNNSNLVCYRDFENDNLLCKPLCSSGHFSLTGMTECMPYLKCRDFESIKLQIIGEIGNGAVKTVNISNIYCRVGFLMVLSWKQIRFDYKFNISTAYQACGLGSSVG